MDIHLTFNIGVIIFTIAIMGVLIPNIFYFEQIYNSEGTQNMGKHSAIVMVLLNSLALFFDFLILLWAVIRFFQTK